MGYGSRGRSGRSSRDEKESKYCRVTGVWQNKKNNALWTGKLKAEQIEKVIEKLEEADKANAEIVVFLWENRDKDGQRDPDFTIQIAVSEDDGRGRFGRSSHSSRESSRRSSRDDRDRDPDSNNDNEEEQTEEQPEEEEEKPRGKKSSKQEKEEPRSRARSAGSSKKDKNDW